jgi:UDP-N-acetylmuramate dehydrogenase
MLESKLKNTGIDYKTGALFRNHTWYGIGGEAKIMAFPKNENELCSLIVSCRESGSDFFILGKGSNILVSDDGYDGCVIDMTRYFLDISTEGKILRSGSGVTMEKLAFYAQSAGLTGLEKLSGIPGTVGGAVMMNAGCYNSEIADLISRVKVLDGNCSFSVLTRGEIDFGYRRSGLDGKIVTEVELSLEKADKNEIRKTMHEINLKRFEKQPYNYPSCGSVFKRPEGHFAGKLIEDCGLKGTAEGGAVISDLHAGFIINKGGATAKDVLKLIRIIKEKVFERTGVALNEEVIFLGFKPEDLK